MCSVSPYAVAAEFPVYLPHDVTHSLVLELTAFEMNTMDTYKDEHLQDLLVNEPTPDDPYGLGDVDRHLFLSEYEAAFIALLCAEICLRRQDVWFAMEQVMLARRASRMRQRASPESRRRKTGSRA